MFLSFASAHMPNDHQNLSKYSDEVDGLFEQLVSSVNADAEIAKLRSSMSHILRKPGDSVQTPLYRLKTCYEMLLQINFPDLELDKVKIQADNYCCNSVKYLVSPNTSKIIAEYVILKQQRSEHLSLVKLCNVFKISYFYGMIGSCFNVALHSIYPKLKNILYFYKYFGLII